MPDLKAKISQSGLLKGSSSSQKEVVASRVEVNTAGINLGDLIDVTITSPADGSYVVYQSSSNTFLDDQTIIKTNAGIDVTGTITFDGGTTSADLNFGDSDKAVFGASGNLKIYFDGNHSYVYDTGPGDLRVRGNNLYLQNDTGGNYLSAINGGATTLFHNGNTKIATTANGLSITGRAIASEDFRADIFRSTTYSSSSFLDFDDDETRGSSNSTTLESIAGMNLKFDNNASDGQSFRIFGNTDGTNTAAFTIDNELNVGIGTETPSANLHVATPSGNPTIAGNDISNARLLLGTTSAGMGLDNNEIAVAGDHLFLETLGNNDIKFRTNGTQVKAIIKGNGRVGIGTDDPDCKFHVKDTNNVPVKIETTHGSGNARMVFKPGANEGWNIGANDNGHFTIYDIVGGQNSVIVESGAAINTLYVDGGSQVGIGTNDPNRKLHVKGSGNTVAVKVEATDTNQASLDMQNSAGWFRFITNDGALRIYDQGNNAERWRISNSGNVGIGIPNPTAKLDVKGTGGSTSGFSFRNSHENVRGYFGSDNDNADFLFTYVGTNSAEVKLKQNGNVILCESAGNVGINNYNPATTLDVDGTITATALNVTGTATATALNVTGTATATTFSGDLNGTINTATTATTQSASDNSTKVATTAYVTTAVAAGVSDLVGGAGEALDTLNELATALGNDANFATTTSTALTNRLRVDVNNQSLTATQKTNAFTNLGVSSFGISLIDDADAAAARTTLGLGTAATTAATAYATAAQGSLADSALQSGDVLSTLTVTGPLVHNQVGNNMFEIIATDVGSAVDPIISLYRNDSQPANNDKLGVIQFNGKDLAGNKTEYASIHAEIQDRTNASEDGRIIFTTIKGATSTTALKLDSVGATFRKSTAAPGTLGNIDGGAIFPSDLGDESGDMKIYGYNGKHYIDFNSSSGELYIGDQSTTNYASVYIGESLKVRENLIELSNANDDALPKPVISLYRNSASPAVNDRLGSVRFFGENASGEKVFYAGIDGMIGSATTDGAHVGAIRFTLADGGSSGNAVTDPTADITTDEDPVMSLYKYGLVMRSGNDIHFGAKDDNLVWDTGSHRQELRGRDTESSGGNSLIQLPDITSGTVITTGNLSDITSTGTLTALTVDNIAIDGTTIGHTGDTDILTFASSEPKLTVNASAMEITDSTDGSNAGPTLSLYRNSSSPANGDQIGRLLFLGENDADEKVYYGQLTCEIGGAGVDQGGEQSEFKFHVTDGTPSGTDNIADDLTEDYTTIGPSDNVPLKINSAGCTINGADGLIMGAGKNIVFTGSNNVGGYGSGSYQNYLRQEEISHDSVNAQDDHSYQMLPIGSGVLLRSRGSDRVLDNNVDKSTEVITFGSAHGLRTGDPIIYNDAKGTSMKVNDGTDRNIDAERLYAIVTGTTTIKLASTLANALAGTALNITNDGGDNQSFLFPNQMDEPIQMRDQVFELGHKTTTDRDALDTPTKHNGAIIYNDTTNQINAYVNSAWQAVATTNAESFTGGVTVTGGLQASQKCIFHSTSTLTISKTTHAGSKIVYTSDAANTAFTFPVIVTADIGDTYTILNASNKTVTLNHVGGTTNKFKKFVLGSSVQPATTVTIPACGAVEVVVMDKGGECYVVFGSGVLS